MELTPEQEVIIKDNSNLVVIARPGSGKTQVLSIKIRNILDNLPEFKGVIAISYTNKASDELKKRSLRGGINEKGSFFGTIDRFFIAEIIIPFGRHIFGNPIEDIEIMELSELPTELVILSTSESPLTDPKYIGNLYLNGKILLDNIGWLALFIFENSQACRKYIKSRYSYLFVDEYQDCDEFQHSLFLKLVELGIIAIAMGDLNQSIFGFAKKSPRFLASLAQSSNFVTYNLERNHRCHLSIVNYATKLMSPTYKPIPNEDIFVFEKRVTGSEIEVAKWLSNAIPKVVSQFDDAKEVAILVKSNATRDIIHKNISLPHKVNITTPIDEDASLWGTLFRKTLNWMFNNEITKHELTEMYLNAGNQQAEVRKAMKILKQLDQIAKNKIESFESHIDIFINLATLLLPKASNIKAVNNLRVVLSDVVLLQSFIPPKAGETQLMTLHKSKGLEFDIIFHVNLNKWILPQYKQDYSQELNLHYVGITRAKKCCILCIHSKRHRGSEVIDAEDSEFLTLNEVQSLRIPCPV